MNRKQRDLLRKFGPVDSWLIPAKDIETIIMTQTCRHGRSRIDACRDCFTGAMLRRQTTILAERLGCSPEDAAVVSRTLCDQFLEEVSAQ